MSTTLIPLDPATTTQRSTRILSISADLLPEEIVAARRARRTRGLVFVVVAIVAVLCASWFVLALHGKREAQQELDAAKSTVADLQRDQKEFDETLKVQADTKQLNDQLRAVMAEDLDWAALLATLRNAGAPSHITVEGVNGRLNTAEDTESKASVLPGSATDTVGTLVVTGAGPDKKAVAAYVDALGKQSVVTNPYLTSVASDKSGGVTFSLRLAIKRAALCGRFTTACETPGGN
jgi:Tfp pilus assembly protein PilN